MSGQGIWPKAFARFNTVHVVGDWMATDGPAEIQRLQADDCFEVVPVVPASLCEELAEALEYAEGQLRGGVAVGKVPQQNVARAYQRIDEVVERYREAVAEGGEQ